MISTILTIARKELIEIVRDGRFRWLSASILLLLAGALAAGWLQIREERRERAAAERAEAAAWLDQGERNPHSAAHFGRYVFKPATPLAAVDRGVWPFVGSAAWLEAHAQNPFEMRSAEDSATTSRFGDLSAAWILQYLAPLFVILVVFGAFAGERERGTLRQLLATGVRPGTLALGKAAGIAAALALVAVPASLVGAVVLSVGVPGASAADTFARGLGMTALYLAYAAIFLGLGLAVSAWARTSRQSLVALLAFWAVSCLLVPRLAADLAERIAPTPTPRAFYAAIAESEESGVAGAGTREERRAELERRVLEKYRVASLEELPVNFAGISLQAAEEHSNRVFDRHFGELQAVYDRQEAVHRWASVLSPLLAVRGASMGLAGTDLAHHEHFAVAAEDHRRALVKQLNDHLRDAADDGSGFLAGPELWARTIPFEYRSPGPGWALARHARELLFLGSWLVAVVVAAALTVRALRPV